MTQEDPQFVSIHTVADRFEADLIMHALEKEEIHAILRTFEETPYNGLFVSQRGWGRVLVAEEDVTKAREVIDPLIQDLQKTRLYSDPSELDPLLWENLRQADPRRICINAQIRYDSEAQGYTFSLLNGTFVCLPHQQTIEVLHPLPHPDLNFEFYLVVLHYLLEAQNVPLSATWISEKDIPGGQMFFRGPHKFPTEPLLALFGRKPEIFRAAAQSLGGTPVEMGDLGYRLWAFPRIPLLFVLWEGDEEFEPALHIRFNSTVTSQLESLDSIWALVNVVCRNLKAAARNILREQSDI
ncbi:DUF3786 domain-containing protein [Desulfoferrobacter suflitae]|uniref:DUF3786 domain-containing protein n=1 Tax=Desulfoferrobacter suflitae TaxID=2865782 RepID=UPI002164AA3A|nr:DUF3786 domain-containing protein [Desulfoferrobacter suflitae]MCK8602590.1 DUF3786 domain-containing protein [Desulfoferrobacter suflitae]